MARKPMDASIHDKTVTLVVDGIDPVISYQFNKYCLNEGRRELTQGTILSKILLMRLEENTGKTFDQMCEEFQDAFDL